MRYAILVLAAAVCGCGLTASERNEIIASASEQAAATASAAAYKQIYDHALAQGKSVEEARTEAQKAAEVAGQAAAAVAGVGAGRLADAVQDEKRSKTSGWLAAALPGILALAGGLAKKYVGAP